MLLRTLRRVHGWPLQCQDSLLTTQWTITTMQGSWRGARSLRNVNLQPFCNAEGRTVWSEAKHCAVLGTNQSQYCSQNKHLRAWRTCENKAHPLLTAAIWSASTLKISGLGANPLGENWIHARFFVCYWVTLICSPTKLPEILIFSKN